MDNHGRSYSGSCTQLPQANSTTPSPFKSITWKSRMDHLELKYHAICTCQVISSITSKTKLKFSARRFMHTTMDHKCTISKKYICFIVIIGISYAQVDTSPNHGFSKLLHVSIRIVHQDVYISHHH